MSNFARAALVAALAMAGLASAGCAELTRPDEIIILAEPPPAPKAVVAAVVEQADGTAENVITTQLGARGRPAPKAGGG